MCRARTELKIPATCAVQVTKPKFCQGTGLLRGLGGSGLSDSLGERVLLRPHAGELFNLRARPELKGFLGPHNGLGIRLWVHDRNMVQDGVMVSALVALGNAHILGVRITRGAKPGLVIETG